MGQYPIWKALVATIALASASAVAVPVWADDNEQQSGAQDVPQSNSQGTEGGSDKGPDASQSGSGSANAALVDINLLNINDFHGRIDGTLNENKDALVDSLTVRFAATVEAARAQHPDTSLFLSAGDNVGASLFASSIQKDEPAMDVLNALGLKATAVGNHEFDQPNDIDRIAARLGAPLLGANVYHKGTNTPALDEYAVFDVGGVRVAVIGVVTRDTPSLVSPTNVEELDFGDPVQAVNRVAQQISHAGSADVIVAEYHEGSPVGGAASLADATAASPVFAQIVNDTSPAVDVIFTGHTHQTYVWDGKIPGTDRTRPIVQTGNYAANVGQVTLSYDTAAKAVASYQARNIPVTETMPAQDSYPSIPTVYGIVLAAMQHADSEGSAAAATLTGAITTGLRGEFVDGKFRPNGDPTASLVRDVREEASTLGTLVGNSFMDSLSHLPDQPDFGIMNPGGMRAELIPDEHGVINVAQARAILPFDNEMSVVTLTGKQIVEVLQQQWQRDAEGNVPARNYLQLSFSDNFSYTYTEVADPVHDGQTVGVINSASINNVPLDMDATYRVATLSFLAAGGDNFRAFTNGTALNTGLADWEAWLTYLDKESPIDPIFARSGVYTEGIASGDTWKAGEKREVTLSRFNVPSVGAPDNTVVEAALIDEAGVIYPLHIQVGKSGGGAASNDKAALSFTVPEELDGTFTFRALFTDSGTQVRVPLQISAKGAAVATLSVDPGSVQAGGKVTVSGSKWTPDTQVSLLLGDVSLGTATAGSDGVFKVTAVIPKDTKAGNYQLVAKTATQEASAKLAVTAASSSSDTGKDKTNKLAKTGAEAGIILLAAAGLGGTGYAIRRTGAKTKE